MIHVLDYSIPKRSTRHSQGSFPFHSAKTRFPSVFFCPLLQFRPKITETKQKNRICYFREFHICLTGEHYFFFCFHELYASREKEDITTTFSSSHRFDTSMVLHSNNCCICNRRNRVVGMKQTLALKWNIARVVDSRERRW